MVEQADQSWADDVLRFWFHELKSEQWFKKDDAVDAAIAARFAATHANVDAAEDAALLTSPDTARAAILVLDQFSRNMLRGTSRSFASDAKALKLASEFITRGWDQPLNKSERLFVYLPFEHAEDLRNQARSVALISSLADDSLTKFALDHQVIIQRFGRFPHRNDILGRKSTPEEIAFLQQPGSSF
jgi:uncharacterized protein (DUF924 family)